MINLQLTPFHFSELHKKGYSLDILFILKLIEGEYEIEDTPKIQAILQTVIRKGLVTDDQKLSTEGKSLLSFISNCEVNVPLEKKKPDEKVFERWWKAYPPTDTFTYNGKKFTGTRALRTKKEDCKIKLNKILGEGEYTIDDLISALELEVNQKVQNSVKENTNKLKYMQNSLTYLNQRSFEGFVELLKAGHKEEVKSVVKGTVDI